MWFRGVTFVLAVFAGQASEEEQAKDLARRALAGQLRVAEESIRVVDIGKASWSEGELECAEPSGEKVSGFRVRLKHLDRTYEARVAEGRVAFCVPERAMQKEIEQAKEDLARRLSISEDEIEVLEAEPVTWPDSSLGCPKPGMSYLQVLTEGYRIRLRAQDGIYSYHGARGREPFLCQPGSHGQAL